MITHLLTSNMHHALQTRALLLDCSVPSRQQIGCSSGIHGRGGEGGWGVCKQASLPMHHVAQSVSFLVICVGPASSPVWLQQKAMKAYRLRCEGRATQEGGRNLVLQVDRELQRGISGVDCRCHCPIAECPVDVRPSLEVLSVIPLPHLHPHQSVYATSR